MVGSSNPTMISLFSGAMGLDLGFEMEDFDICVTLDNDKDVIATIKKNRKKIPIIPDDIFKIPTAKILKEAHLKRGEVTVVTGGPPCQPFSTAGNRKAVSEKKGTLIYQFLRVIKESQPKFFVFENVSGIVSAARKRTSFYERIKKKQEDLDPHERLGSAFVRFIEEFKKIRTLNGNYYKINYAVLNSADFGVPQKRKRFILIGSRNGKKIALPTPTHGKPGTNEVKSGERKPWVTLREALKGLVDNSPEYLPFPKSWGKYMQYIPEGGCWRDLPKELHKEALAGAYDSEGTGKKGGRTGFYRRLSWNKPAPTLLASPIHKASVIAHPVENRPLTVKEYARLQGFPDNWEFIDSIPAKYRLIGQAVPIQLGRAIAEKIFKENNL